VTGGLENRSGLSASDCTASTSGIHDFDLAFYLALLAKKSPDLATIVQSWEKLPEAVRAAITGLVKATAK
jgi:hypothetical protein